MKNIIILITSIVIISACEPEPRDTLIEYTINNYSTHNIQLGFYNIYINDEVVKDTSFLLNINTSVKFHPPFGGTDDSASLIFDNYKKIVYRRDDENSRNILNKENYIENKINDFHFKYEYIITDEDYNNAALMGK